MMCDIVNMRAYRSTQDPAVADGERGTTHRVSIVVATVVTVCGVHVFPPFLYSVRKRTDKFHLSISQMLLFVKGIFQRKREACFRGT